MLLRGSNDLCFEVVALFVIVIVGPVVAEAMFMNREEIPIYPIYRDPVSFLWRLFIVFASHYREYESQFICTFCIRR